jgi:hypothetical protein
MRDRFAENFTLYALRKNKMKKYLSPSNMKKYNVYFKRYVQISMKETIRLYTSMKEFGLGKGV